MTNTPKYVGGHGLLEGKNVLVTAAAGTGIGFATAIRCVEEGAAALVISDIHERRLGEAADKIEGETGKRPHTVLCNVTKEYEVQAMFDAAIDEMGHVDVLMNNAGLGGYAKIVDMTDEQWNVVLDVTLNGCFRCTRAALKHMMPRGQGAIVNNASVLGWRAQEGQAHYAAAKAGVMALTRCSAIEAAEAAVQTLRSASTCRIELPAMCPTCTAHLSPRLIRSELAEHPPCGHSLIAPRTGIMYDSTRGATDVNQIQLMINN